MVSKLLVKLFGTKHERDIKKMMPLIQHINELEKTMLPLSDEQLANKTFEFKERYKKGETLDQMLPEAFAVCREAAKRKLGMRHYDVQLIGGLSLHRGSISEMRTGEGKTLVATLPVYLNALSGDGVHVVTVNDYLAKRDCEWMGQLYNFLHLTTGTIIHERTDRERKQAYAADITYGTNNEFGFDYLRDNMKFDLDDYVQRVLNYAIVDECDSILIDEARTPLIISGPSEDSVEKYYEIDKIIPHLKRDVHFTIEEKSKTASLTDEGNSKVESLLSLENLYDATNIQLLHHIYQGLKAYNLYQKDVDYMVKDGEIIIVDEFTGRLMPGRRWSEGLHQAIEAKEKVSVKSENQTLATITFQNYFRMYKKLSGMTGTAETEAAEFRKIYNLEVTVIPTNKPIARLDENDVIYKTENAKFKAIVTDIKARKEIGQPVLVGTVSIEKSERLSRFLKNEGVNHNVLNAKHHEREAEIVAQAGRFGSVTIATNMAGRGTDIVLGGNPEFLAKAATQGAEGEGFEQRLKEFVQTTAADKEKVKAAGGLYIVGTERHESRRIDNQLRGRAGRQGDPGSSRFYLSLEDNLMRIFNGERLQKIMSTFNFPEDEPIEAGMVSRAIEGAQRKVEGHNFDIRKHLLEYDDVMNQQRTAIYNLRREVLKGETTKEIVTEMLSDVTSDLMDQFVPMGSKRDGWDLPGLSQALQAQFGAEAAFDTSISTEDALVQKIKKIVQAGMEKQESNIRELFPQVQKMVLLQSIDQRWKEHLARMDQLKEGINLRAYAQKDPLIEYKKEAFAAFAQMNKVIKFESMEKIFKVQLVSENAKAQLADQQQSMRRSPKNLDYTSPDNAPEQSVFAQQRPPTPRGAPADLGLGRSEFDDVQSSFNDRPGMSRADRRKFERKNKKSGKIKL